MLRGLRLPNSREFHYGLLSLVLGSRSSHACPATEEETHLQTSDAWSLRTPDLGSLNRKMGGHGAKCGDLVGRPAVFCLTPRTISTTLPKTRDCVVVRSRRAVCRAPNVVAVRSPVIVVSVKGTTGDLHCLAAEIANALSTGVRARNSAVTRYVKFEVMCTCLKISIDIAATKCDISVSDGCMLYHRR